MFELMNIDTGKHFTLDEDNFISALDEAKQIAVRSGNYAIIDNRTMQVVIRFNV